MPDGPGDIRFASASFGSEDRTVLRDIDLHIPAGTTVA